MKEKRIGNLKLIGTRSLNFEEIDELQNEILMLLPKHLFFVFCRWAPPIALSILVPLVVFDITPPSPLFLVMFLLVPGWLQGRDTTIRFLATRRDVSNGEAEIYSESGECQDNQAGSDHPDDDDNDMSVVVELLSSGRLWTKNSVRTAPYIIVEVSRLGVSGITPAMRSFPKRFVLNQYGDRLFERSLTTSELDELLRHSRSSMPWMLSVPLVPCLAICFSTIFTSERISLDDVIATLIFFILSVFLIYKIYVEANFRASMRISKRLGYVLYDNTEQYFEILPNSGILWAIDGEPAGWRLATNLQQR